MAAKNFHRRSIRFKGRDYTAPGIYFVTICSADGSNIFGRVNDGTVVENRLGQLVRARWLEIPRHFANVELDAFVVMPNHVHGLITAPFIKKIFNHLDLTLPATRPF